MAKKQILGSAYMLYRPENRTRKAYALLNTVRATRAACWRVFAPASYALWAAPERAKWRRMIQRAGVRCRHVWIQDGVNN